MGDDGYRELLARADGFFSSVVATQRENLQCGDGCSLCCYGLFEIGAADVAVLADGLARLHPRRRAMIIRRAETIIRQTAHPDLRSSDPKERAAFFDRSSSIACPNLSDQGRCLVYESRPLVCRTFGLPLRDGNRYLGDICDLNFNEATPAQRMEAAWDLRWEDVASSDEQYSIPEAILLAARIEGWT